LSEVKSKEECLLRGTSMKFVNLFVTDVKKLIPHCESKCMQSIELKTNYKTESGIDLSLIRFIQSCMPRRKVCHGCIIVLKVQSLGERIYDVLSDMCLKDIVSLVFEYIEFIPLQYTHINNDDSDMSIL
jgi:hypothetical protein